MIRLLAAFLLTTVMTVSHAGIEAREFATPDQELRYRELIEELRCPKCQNQNLAGSDAPIAKDLKDKTYTMIVDGKSDGEIRQYLKERYGDFISYKPPVRASTFLLWGGPGVLLLAGFFFVLMMVRRRGAAAAQPASLTPEEQQRLDALLQASSRQDHDRQG